MTSSAHNSSLSLIKQEKLEKFIQDRNCDAYEKLFRSSLDTKALSPKDACLLADGYRRIGQFSEAFATVKRAYTESEKLDHREEIELRLWLARFFSYTGANQHAYSILNDEDHGSSKNFTLDPVFNENFSAFRFTSSLLLSDWEFEESLSYCEKTLSHKDFSRGDHSQQMIELIKADALIGLQRFDEALEISTRLSKEAATDLAKSISLQVCGEIFARSGEYNIARKFLSNSLKYFEGKSLCTDQALIFKWLGHCEARLGDTKTAEKCFSQSLQLIKPNGLRIEAYFDLLELMVRSGLENSLNLQGIKNYPGISPSFAQFFEKYSHEKNIIQVARRYLSQFTINLKSEEYFFEERWHCHLPLELKALAMIWLSGEWGISMYRLESVLWPNTPLETEFLGQRLHKLVQRLRTKYEIEILNVESRVLLSSDERKRIYVNLNIEKPMFLISSKNQSYTWRNISEFYKIGRSRSFAIAQKWRENGW